MAEAAADGEEEAEQGGGEEEVSFPPLMVAQALKGPRVVNFAARPGDGLPSRMANRAHLPVSAFNPFCESAPRGTWTRIAKQVPECAKALAGLPADHRGTLLMIPADTISRDMDLDHEMECGGHIGFCVHTKRDVLLCGLTAEAAAASMRAVAATRGATETLDSAAEMIPLISAQASRKAKTFHWTDDFTTRFGYSVNQVSKLGTNPDGETLARHQARGGPPNMHFRNTLKKGDMSVGASRAALRMQMVSSAAHKSEYFRESWLPADRPRVTTNFQTECTWTRAPFTVMESLPCASDTEQVRLSGWETVVRGIEEHLAVAIFGCLPNITWGRILAKVFEKAERAMGEFEVRRYRMWCAAQSQGLGPQHCPGLGCPWMGGAGRLLPKGAAGIAPFKPMHDDNNAMISLGCWSNHTAPSAPTTLDFLLNGFRVGLRVTHHRWVLFMGYVPHETRPLDPAQAAAEPRVHHSSFAKPDAEHLATHILSKLPGTPNPDGTHPDWTLDQVHRLRPEAFRPQSMCPILAAHSSKH